MSNTGSSTQEAVAYAVGFIDTTVEPPTVTGVGIFSAPAGGVTTDQRKAYPFDITADGGANLDFEGACAQLREQLERYYPWAIALMTEKAVAPKTAALLTSMLGRLVTARPPQVGASVEVAS